MAEVFIPKAMDFITPAQNQQRINIQQAQQQQTAQAQQQQTAQAQQKQQQLEQTADFEKTATLFNSVYKIDRNSAIKMLPQLEQKAGLPEGTLDPEKIRTGGDELINNTFEIIKLQKAGDIQGASDLAQSTMSKFSTKEFSEKMEVAREAISPKPVSPIATSRFKDKLEASRAALKVELGREPDASEVLERTERLVSETPTEAVEKEKGKLDVKRIAGLKAKLPTVRRSLSKLERRTNIVKDTIKEAVDLVSPFTAGAGSILSLLPATEQRTLREKLQTIRANIGFKELREMREASPTGGALGQISELENVLLQSVIASLDQGLHPTELINNLQRIEEDFDNTLTATNEFFNLDFGEVLPKEEAPTEALVEQNTKRKRLEELRRKKAGQ